MWRKQKNQLELNSSEGFFFEIIEKRKENSVVFLEMVIFQCFFKLGKDRQIDFFCLIWLLLELVFRFFSSFDLKDIKVKS